MFFITESANAPTAAANAASAKRPDSTAIIIKDRDYTPFWMSANAVGAFSQAHTENRVYRSGKPAGAIFMCSGSAGSSS
jgi:hypothetical protein